MDLPGFGLTLSLSVRTGEDVATAWNCCFKFSPGVVTDRPEFRR